MSTVAVLKRPVIEKSIKENILKLLDKGNKHGNKHGITEEDVNNEIEAYRREKAYKEQS